MSDDFCYLSPHKQYGFQISAWEARMSLWVESPTLLEISSQTPLLAFSDSNWSLDDAKWHSNTVVGLTLRKYPGDHTPGQFEITVDCEAKSAKLDSGAHIPLARLEQALETLYQAGRTRRR